MLVVGLTGGIGSGKSTVATHFQHHGIEVIDADVIARNLVEPGSPSLKKIHEYFGDKILLSDSSLNRRALRDIIFSTPDEKTWLENLLHPQIRELTKEQLRSSTSPYLIYMAPLLLENQLTDLVNRVLVVDLPEGLQIERAAERDNANKTAIQKIIASQIDRKTRLAQADDVIDNSNGEDAIAKQVALLHEQYLKLTQQ